MGHKYQGIEVQDCLSLTDKAALLMIDDEEYWVPLSQIEDNDDDLDVGFSGSLFLTTWILDEKGIEY